MYESNEYLQIRYTDIENLPPILRVYVGCALRIADFEDNFDLVKIHINSGKVSFLKYIEFDTSPIPRLLKRTKINLKTQQIKTYFYEKNLPVLYMKSAFLITDNPDYSRQVFFDEQIKNLLNITGYGPREDELREILQANKSKIDGYKIEIIPPNLSDLCGKYLTFSELINCGETQQKLKLNNAPKEIETYHALRQLMLNVIDPIIEYYGSIELTYGFCSHDLALKIKSRIAPKIDQHSAMERRRNGKLICDRGGAAIDFLVRYENMKEVAEWIMNNLPYDRLYFYGNDRPIHVSYGPENVRQALDCPHQVIRIKC